jgi:GT2 family glycosyltransferase
MNDYPSVAVVILNWNGKNFLEQFLPSVSASDYPNLRIYVADNASTDNSIAFVRENFPRLEIIQNSGNVGFAEGYNQALAGIRADYYVLLNQDVAVEENWLRPIVRLMESDRMIGACQPKMLSWKQEDHFEYAGAAGGWLDRWGYPFCRGRIFGTVEQDNGQYDAPERVFWASGAALFIRAELYHEAGGLDPYFFAHMEEIDLCWRLQRLGYQIWCCPESVVHHVGGGSLPQGNPRKTFLNFRNNLIMLHKNLHGFERYSTLFIRLMLDGIAGAKSLFQGNTAEIFIILKAHWAYYSWLKGRPDGVAGHGKIPRVRFRVLRGVYPRSVVWQYFIRRRKTFSSLEIMDK